MNTSMHNNNLIVHDPVVMHNFSIIEKERDNDFYPENNSGAFILLVCPSTGKILLGKRHSESDYQPNKWFCFGGHCEDDETPLQTAIREVDEECEIGNDSYEIVENPAYVHKNDDKNGIEHTIYVYLASTKNEITPHINFEHSDAKWFTINDLIDLNLFDTMNSMFTDDAFIKKIKRILNKDI